MSAPVLATKLYIPPPRPGIVPRSRLIERLNEGLAMGCKLTLISASAGFGKTTLVSEWITRYGKPVAWVSLDEGDNDPVRFITYLIAALQTIKVGLGEGVLPAFQSHQPPQVEVVLTALLNEISLISDSFLLILDDYHVIDSKPVDEALAFLVERLQVFECSWDNNHPIKPVPTSPASHFVLIIEKILMKKNCKKSLQRKVYLFYLK